MGPITEYTVTNAQRRTEPMERAIEIELDTYIMTELYNEYAPLDMAYDQAFQETLMDDDYDEYYAGVHVFMPNLTIAADMLSGHLDAEIGALSRSDAAVQALNDTILDLTEAAKHTPADVGKGVRKLYKLTINTCNHYLEKVKDPAFLSKLPKVIK